MKQILVVILLVFLTAIQGTHLALLFSGMVSKADVSRAFEKVVETSNNHAQQIDVLNRRLVEVEGKIKK